MSEVSNTEELIAEEILKILNKIGINKFYTILTDNGPNVLLAWQLISTQFPKIFNVRCIAYCMNLISHDILQHDFAAKIIKYCNILVSYFKKSHQCGDLLEKLILKNEILEGGLKTYVKTR